MDLGLKGRIALVTGSSRGIGRATARQFANEGASVAITYHTALAQAETLADEIRGNGGRALTIPMDLASPDSIESSINAIESRWGQLDILVNNAFDFGPQPISEIPAFELVSPTEWQRVLRANIEGTAQVTQAAIPMMRRQKWGRIVNVSATLAEDGLPGAAWYSMAKASLHGLTRSLSKELGPEGILVNTVMPGLTATDRLALITPDRRRRIEENIPIRRVLQPMEVAGVIVFLCSSVNSVVTGELLRVSGGRL